MNKLKELIKVGLKREDVKYIYPVAFRGRGVFTNNIFYCELEDETNFLLVKSEAYSIYLVYSHDEKRIFTLYKNDSLNAFNQSYLGIGRGEEIRYLWVYLNDALSIYFNTIKSNNFNDNLVEIALERYIEKGMIDLN